MRRMLAFLAAVILVLGLAACGGKTPGTTVPSTAPTTEPVTVPTTVPVTEPVTEPVTVPTEPATVPTEPEPEVSFGGVDLTGLSYDEAVAKLGRAISGYKLTLTVNGRKLTLTGEEMGMGVSADNLKKLIEAAHNGGSKPSTVFTYSRTNLKTKLANKLNTAAENASVTYSSAEKKFVVSKGSEGILYDLDAAADAAAKALRKLNTKAEVTVGTSTITPELTSESESVKLAAEAANGYLKASVTYVFATDKGEVGQMEVGPGTISRFVKISGTMEVTLSKDAMADWAAEMDDRYSEDDTKGEFVTTGGSTISTKVTYKGQKVKEAALVEDLYKVITEGLTGTRTVPYTVRSSKPYGGSYVEVDLSSQRLWLYKDGEQIVSTKLVSGCVAEGHRTPTGVYSIYAKQTDRYLTGADYRSFVSYWMPFNGGYGLHDASWRSSFGGDIYLYDGSHGCVNLPSSAAKKIFNNVSVGTKVILYGGKTEVPDLEQKLSGTTSYTVDTNSAPFKLDVKPKYKGAELTYSSSDKSVVTVSKDGTVTVKGAGTATITVTAAEFDFYTGAELKITITVKEAPATEPTEPKPTEPKPTEPAPTDPQPTEPKPTEPAPTEPAPTEPAPTEPSEPAPSTPETEPEA